jgi:hypothetical protein
MCDGDSQASFHLCACAMTVGSALPILPLNVLLINPMLGAGWDLCAGGH